MKDQVKNRWVVLVFSLVLAGLALGNMITPDLEFSTSERRKLKSLPSFSYQSLVSGDLFKEFDKYSLDQFVMRDFFRGIKAWSKYNIFQQMDNNKIFIVGGNINKIEYPLDERSIIRAAEKFNLIKETYFKDKSVYTAIIPDKNVYYAAPFGYLAMDYNRLVALFNENAKGMDYIDLFTVLSGEDYYKTDIHWDQDRILPVADLLLDAMETGKRASDILYEKRVLSPFYGSYYGQGAIKVKPDTLVYLTNDWLERAKVYDYEKDRYINLYMPELFDGLDPYDVYLAGAKPLLTIENPDMKTGKELVLFRDSFGSSIAPLLLSGYAKVTLVDIRYIASSLLGEYIDFSKDQDILFLYNAMALNNSAMFK